ncbi:MAG: hypothetical protein AVDCRST_MAG36-2446 [uncultured Nocardioidaceae bacterium]|uniref:Uncharacterized protein n=1 Tax=uncultured Nocardioidaceae bacterium TaxID=253824 RepID=A0A6J4MFV3_9ACTN|nr:MAG: hypothetical protein AVDCRST_MAG36-2446 [uncultured Nocardioidaceae bacterium]
MTGDARPSGAEVRDGLTVNLVGAGLLLVVGVVVAVAGAALGAVVGGRPQVLGAVLGSGLVTGCCLFGTVTVSLVAAYAPRASLLVALLTYVLQVGVLALVLARVQAHVQTRERTASDREPVLDPQWVGGAVVVATVVWVVLLVVRALRSEPVSGPGSAG